MQAMSLPASCAVGILGAWQLHDMEQLNVELERAAAIDSTPCEDSDEAERAELLGSIAAEMRGMLASGRVQDEPVYFSLLKHLAASRAAMPAQPGR